MAGRMLSGCIQLRRAKKFSISTPSSKAILKDLPEHIVPLKLGLCQVYLVGVNHSPQKSVADVQKIVSVVKPDFVFLELCENRGGLLWCKEIPTTKEMAGSIMKNWKDQNIHQLYASFKDEKACVILGDRPIQVTMNRLWRKMPLLETIKYYLLPFPECFEGLSKKFPTWTEVYVHERDIYMAKRILSWAKAKKRRSIVAVVGRGHLEGIEKHLQHKKQLHDLSVKDLMTIPPPNHNTKILTSMILVPTGVAMAFVGIAIWKCFQ